MKLVKSLLLSSAAGMAAVASAQAADLPFRKAAPVEYVRVCDYTGAGYFYIPGTDTCLRFEGYAQANFAYIEPTRAFVPGLSQAGTPFNRTGGAIVKGEDRQSTGLKAEGRLSADARTQTAYGTLRTFVRFVAAAGGGIYVNNLLGSSLSNPNNPNLNGSSTNAAALDRAFVQFAGFTAGRVQSFFDFYADNYNYESIATSDTASLVFAYTATFGAGFSATIAVEDATIRRDGIKATQYLTDPNRGIGADLGARGTTPTNSILSTSGSVAYGGEEIPDIVGALNVDQAWGKAQLSAAYHQIRATDTVAAVTAPFGLSVPGAGTQDLSKDGFAVQAGVQFKLPMLAAGDTLWLQGAYQNGAYLYQDTAGFANGGFNGLAVGGFIHQDADAIAFRNPNGSVSLSLSEGFSVSGAFQHYFTPNFYDVVFGSYQEVTYGSRSKNTDWTLGGLGDSDSWRVGNQFVWTPVNNMIVGIEIIYMQVNQTLAHNPGLQATTIAGLGVDRNPSAFEGRLRVERDF